MARREVIEIKCDRCPRVELVEQHSRKEAAFSGEMWHNNHGSEPSRSYYFEDLCGPCWQAVLQHLDQIGKKLDSMSPDRTKDIAKKEST